MTPEEIRCKALAFSLECRLNSDKAADLVSRAGEFEAYILGRRVASEVEAEFSVEPKASGRKGRK